VPSSPKGNRTVLYPVDGAYITGVPHTVLSVTAAEAKRLLKFEPPAYTDQKPKDAPDVEPLVWPSVETEE
jgi:hypothetical protein